MGEAAFVEADVSDAAEAEAMVRFALDTFGGLHVLYNNAGILPPDDGGTLDTPESTWERVMAVNLKGVWLGCKYGIPAMLESGGGSIVNVSSLVALMGSAVPQIAYTASKGGVLAMTRELAVEYARRGIRANVVVPGTDRDAAHGRADGRSRSGRRAGSSTSRWAGPGRRRGDRAVPRCSWPATILRS